MKRSIKWTAAGLVGASLLIVNSVSATPFSIGDSITVAESSVNPMQIVQIKVDGFYTGGVYAGLNHLLINGSSLVDGFCIDPFHFSSSSSLPYTVVNLQNAPKGGAMGANTALLIERLWGSYYAPNMSAANAAGLQIAIWELVGGNSFHLLSGNDYNAGNFLAAVQSANYQGPVADLVGLTGRGQDYVTQNVPDGGTTLGLLSIAMAALLAVKHRLQNCAC